MIFRQAAQRRTQGNSQDNFNKIQGAMSEDEALARALAASMQQSPVTAGDGGGASSQDKSKCNLS